jgi:hydroxyacylglutathione hydrolase
MSETLDIIPIPCLRDNYAYLLRCTETSTVGVVDPSASEPVLAALRERDWPLHYIFNTHHHHDHVGGNLGLLERFPAAKVCAHASDRSRIPGQTDFLEDQSAVTFGNHVGSVLHNPGHTSGAITFVWGDQAFTGDTLFAAGCGRIFEGTPQQMYVSLNEKIGALPDDTRLYFGHEYTEKNLRFALTVEPDNEAAQERLSHVEQARAANEYTTPTTVAEERATNPFLRTNQPTIRATVSAREPHNDLSPSEVLRVLRQLKDQF